MHYKKKDHRIRRFYFTDASEIAAAGAFKRLLPDRNPFHQSPKNF